MHISVRQQHIPHYHHPDHLAAALLRLPGLPPHPRREQVQVRFSEHFYRKHSVTIPDY